MTPDRSQGKKALAALLTLCGQNTYDHDALTRLLVRKGIITTQELDAAVEAIYTKGVSPSEWARRCINSEDNEALNTFFE